MAAMDPEKSREIDCLINELAEKKAQIALLEFRKEAEAILDEMREIRDGMQEIRDDFMRILKVTGKILIAQDRAVWEEIIRKILEDRGRDGQKRK